MFWISQFMRFFAPDHPADFHLRPTLPRGFSSSPRPAGKSSTPHIPGVDVNFFLVIHEGFPLEQHQILLCGKDLSKLFFFLTLKGGLAHSLIISREGLILTLSILPCLQGSIC